MWYNKYKMKKYLKLGIVCGVAVFGIAAFITGITFGILHFNNSNGRGGFDSQVSNPIEEEIAADASIFNFSEENLSQDDSELSYISYRVKKGDMIGFIADEFGITQDTIISVNNIHSSRLIQIGQYLEIPSMHGILYTVRKDGETVATIAEKYKVEAEKCSSVNHIGLEEPLKAGKSLFVPYAELDWVMQIHFGCLRDVNKPAVAQMGSDHGHDAVNSQSGAENLAPLLNAFVENGGLPKIIVYSLNPNDNTAVATILACFQGRGVAGKLQQGSAWWFNDNRPGMRQQLTDLACNGVLGCFVGMLTDSRSFLSYTRHEYFRRILCNLFGQMVEDGEYPADMKTLGRMVENISYYNTLHYFRFDELIK